MFKSEQDIRNFRDVLSAILKDQKDSRRDQDDDSDPRSGRRRNLRLDNAIGNHDVNNRTEISERDMTGMSMHTDDQFMITDRMNVGQSVEVKSSRDLIIKNDAGRYKTPILEENIEMSTNENISNKDMFDRNR